MLIRNSLSPDTIEILETADNAVSVIRRLAERIARVGKLDASRIEQAALDRERTRTTAFANGAALPHCRLADLSRFLTALAILRKPMRWDLEGHAVDRVMLIVGPLAAVSDHLRILANGSQILDSPAISAKLRAAPEAYSAYELMVAAEETLEARRAQVGVLTEIRHQGGENKDFLAVVADQFRW
ncbi:MAG TPA: PTS sugar transporter subunit IIA [Phycisphaerae bacterium]|nr:PTS sugar transporter subunit IIA [Phycisphaerae bacterium]HOJ74905.1 PTS sugar transporter subunit IIA [Phycisphaerae bacterium]HOM51466.1 PTS sugar transporter subunit IIA [Phycisphaerae bacterium]HON69182.1 PTS sugar transporter subunit IIA [Phycisphaerae bacterium]HOQ85579.1 PTS sugar transporter subunit IIA [Phycisphaerae bacterium]